LQHLAETLFWWAQLLTTAMSRMLFWVLQSMEQVRLTQATMFCLKTHQSFLKVVLGGFGAPAGSRVQVGLFFGNAGVVTLDAIVREARDEYAGITAGETLPTPTPSPTATK
jgi:hypothetical protein